MQSFRMHLPALRRAATASMFVTALLFAPALPSSGLLQIASAQANWIILSTYAAAPGQTFSVNGYGFQSGEAVRFTFQGTVLTATAAGNGQVASPQFTVPHVSAGSYPVTVSGQSSGRNQSAQIYVSGFYPVAAPTTFYILPGHRLGFLGEKFAPNEQVTVKRGGTVLGTFNADASGNVSTPDFVPVLRSAAGTTQQYVLNGVKSGASFDISVTVGKYYPQIRPSSYYVHAGMQFSVEGMNFAPNEQVDLFIRGDRVATATSDGAGRVTFGSVTAPADTGNAEVKATGVESGHPSVRTIRVY